MKFGKHFLSLQLRGGAAYIDYKALKKSLKPTTDLDSQRWKQQLFDSIDRVNGSLQQLELKLSAALHTIIGGRGADEIEALLAGHGNFLAEVKMFQRDTALNLVACIKICKKHDKHGKVQLMLQMLDFIMRGKRQLLCSTSAPSLLLSVCKPCLETSFTELMLTMYASTVTQHIMLQHLQPPVQSRDDSGNVMPSAVSYSATAGSPSCKRAKLISTEARSAPTSSQAARGLTRPPTLDEEGTPIERRGKAAPTASHATGSSLGQGIILGGESRSSRASGASAAASRWSASSALRRPLTRRGSVSANPFVHYPAGVIDPSLIFSMERTFLSALNQALYLMLVGGGLTAMNDFDDAANRFGGAIVGMGILFDCMSYYWHVDRIRKLQRKEEIKAWSSKLWVGTVFAAAFTVSVAELVYLYVYPMLDRAKTVEIAAA